MSTAASGANGIFIVTVAGWYKCILQTFWVRGVAIGERRCKNGGGVDLGERVMGLFVSI